MNQDQKSNNLQVAGGQDAQQLQLTLKQTMKENKSLQSKNAKLESKYVELFKQNKTLKQDRQTLISFITSFFNDDSNIIFQQPALGQITAAQLQNISELKLGTLKTKIQELESEIGKIQQNSKKEFQKVFKEENQKINGEWESRLKILKEQQSKQVHSQQKQLESLKKSLEIRTNDLNELKVSLQQKTQELSKVSKQKLKMQHHLNSIRKKEISQEITPPAEKDQSKTVIDKNEYLSLKQQIESLLAKRDQLKRELKKKEEELQTERSIATKLQAQLVHLNQNQKQCDLKYQLVRQCTLQDLQTMILHFHTEAETKTAEGKVQNSTFSEQKRKDGSENDSKEEQTQREYFNNLVIRYIRAQTSGQFEKALTLLQIIGKLVKIDMHTAQSLEQYKAKQKQWWFIKM